MKYYTESNVSAQELKLITGAVLSRACIRCEVKPLGSSPSPAGWPAPAATAPAAWRPRWSAAPLGTSSLAPGSAGASGAPPQVEPEPRAGQAAEGEGNVREKRKLPAEGVPATAKSVHSN